MPARVVAGKGGGFASAAFGGAIQLYKQKETREPDLMPWRLYEPLYIFRLDVAAKFLDNGAGDGNLYPQKTVTFAIFSRAGLEEARQLGGLRFIGHGAHTRYDFIACAAHEGGSVLGAVGKVTRIAKAGHYI